jgi:hypothetical protein
MRGEAESPKSQKLLLKLRHLYRITASGAEAAGCAQGAQGDTLRGAHPGGVLFLDFVFYANGTRFTKSNINT